MWAQGGGEEYVWVIELWLNFLELHTGPFCCCSWWKPHHLLKIHLTVPNNMFEATGSLEKHVITKRETQINSNKDERRQTCFLFQPPRQHLTGGFFLSWVPRGITYRFLSINITVACMPWLSLVPLSGSWCKWMWRGPRTRPRSQRALLPPPLVSWPSDPGRSWHWCGGPRTNHS